MNQFERIRQIFLGMFSPAHVVGVTVTVDVEMVNGEFRVFTQVREEIGDKYMSRQDRVTFNNKKHMVISQMVMVPHYRKNDEMVWNGDWEVMTRIPMFY